MAQIVIALEAAEVGDIRPAVGARCRQRLGKMLGAADVALASALLTAIGRAAAGG